jgi:hypothetical protein
MTGPWKVVEKLDGGLYRIEHQLHKNRFDKKHASMLSPYPLELVPFEPLDGPDNINSARLIVLLQEILALMQLHLWMNLTHESTYIHGSFKFATSEAESRVIAFQRTTGALSSPEALAMTTSHQS